MTALTLNDGSLWEPDPEQVTKWKAAFQAVDVDAEILAASCWLDANPTRRKTKRGIARFLNTWLSRAQDKGGSGLARQKGDTIRTRDMSSLDELSHNFLGDPSLNARFIEKFGQVFIHGKRITK